MFTYRSRDTSNQGLTGDRDALTADLETLRSNRARLEAVILDAHKLLEEKDEELLTLNHDVELAKDASEKLSDKILECRQEVQSRDATIHDLKSKITELYVEFQTTNQNRILAENEVGSLNGELKAMIAAKEWYKVRISFLRIVCFTVLFVIMHSMVKFKCYLILAGLPGVAQAFTTVKYYMYGQLPTWGHPKLFNPSTTCPG